MNPSIRRYCIDLPKLKTGQRKEQMHLGEDFCNLFEFSPFKTCDIEVNLLIERSAFMLDVTYSLSGTLDLECDRCLEVFSFPTATQMRIFYTFDPNMKTSEDDDVIFVESNTFLIDVTKELYDYLVISIPYRKVHEDAQGECSPEVMALIQTEDSVIDAPEIPALTDSRWDALKKLAQTEE